MSDSLQQAEALFELGRWEQALGAFEEHLAQNPEDSHALCMTARCFLNLELYGKASEYASAAIAASPDNSYAHYIQSFVFYVRNLDVDARRAIETALELEPTNPSFHVMIARLEAKGSRWAAALEAAETALQFDPHNSDAQIVRSGALVRLRRAEEAEVVLQSVLESDPENEDALTELGFLHLHTSQWQKALEVFQSALMLDPESEAARAGLVEAMRAKFPVYGLVLRYFLWMNRFSKKYQQVIMYGASVLVRILGWAKKEYPMIAPLLGVLLFFWRIFAYLTWTIRAGTTLFLRLNKYGRQLVNKNELMESNIVGVLWLGALLCWLYHYFVDPFALVARIGIPMFLSMPLVVGGSFSSVDYGWPYYVSRITLVVMLAAGLLGLVLFGFGAPVGIKLLMFYFYSLNFVLLGLAYLEGVEPERE